MIFFKKTLTILFLLSTCCASLTLAQTFHYFSIVNEKYVIDKIESVVTWKGSMSFAGKGEHSGYVNISKGELMIEKGQLAGGTVEVDMNTITDEFHRSQNNLV